MLDTLFYYAAGPVLTGVLVFFAAGLIYRGLTLVAALAGAAHVRDGRPGPVDRVMLLARALLPFHRAAWQRPSYAALRYAFHLCLVAVPIGYSGHVALWEESRLAWTFAPLPDAAADAMTMGVIASSLFFILRRIVVPTVRRTSGAGDFLIVALTAAPFVSGYLLAHRVPTGLAALDAHMWEIHLLSGEAALVMAVLLFCGTRLDPDRCTACAACELACPTGTLAAHLENGRRIFTYRHSRCIRCGACVAVCPEKAATLRHRLSLSLLLHPFRRPSIGHADLAVCAACGEPFVPGAQLARITSVLAADNRAYQRLDHCPRCRTLAAGQSHLHPGTWQRPADPTRRPGTPA